jgi:hypothetical protein
MLRWAPSLAGAGLFAAAAAWALHQQAGVISASWNCANSAAMIWTSGGVAGLVLFVGAILSAVALRAIDNNPSGDGRPRRLIALVGLMAAALFLFAIALQVCAAVFLPGCAG